jgi:ammonia channel protein AmtB
VRGALSDGPDRHRRHPWVLASAALVMFMTPGLAFFYGGLARVKNVLGTVMQ